MAVAGSCAAAAALADVPPLTQPGLALLLSVSLPAGPPRGSQSTYDRALRCVFGADDSELEGERAAGSTQKYTSCAALRAAF